MSLISLTNKKAGCGMVTHLPPPDLRSEVGFGVGQGGGFSVSGFGHAIETYGAFGIFLLVIQISVLSPELSQS